jgi:dTDP-4-amino-4,6-dideoxygalactose transaminase
MGDGGCIVTDDDDIAEWATLFARHGGKGVHAIEGINSRMDGIQAAILCAKLPHLEEWTRARRDIADYYREQLDGVGDLVLPVTAADRTHVFHLFVVRTEQRDELRSFLAEHGVSTGVNYPTALPFCPAYARLGHTPEDFPVAFGHQSRIVSLPIYPEMTREQQDHVVGCVADFFA